jgi:hypothetical protein
LEINATSLQSRDVARFSATLRLYIAASLALIEEAGYRAWLKKNAPADADGWNDALPN